jgi:hypothetical protein
MQGWITKIVAVSFAMLIWGNPASANLSPVADLAGDVDKISAWTTYLNHNYPALELAVAITLDRDQSARAVLREINQLKDDLAGVRDFPAGSFTTLACSRLECVGNRGGR